MDHQEDMPLGFAFQLALNENAMDKFAGLAESEKRQVLEAARNASTKEQMSEIVADLGKMS